VIYGLILIGVILFRPQGIAGVPGVIHMRETSPREKGKAVARETAG
jgi:hypothetical protein